MRREERPNHITISASTGYTRRSMLPLLPVLIVFLWIGFYGLDFGTHWDEPSAKFASIKHTLQTGVFLQGGEGTHGATYNYGGVNYLLTWAGLIPEVSHFLFHDPFTREAFSAAISPDLYSDRVRMKVRRIYLVLSALSVVLLYCLALVMGRSRLEAFLAAAVLGASWEFAYHSRWIAPDVVMTQFSLLSLLCAAMGLSRKSNVWFTLAAAAAGLAIGTKYTAALVVPFVLAAATIAGRREGQTIKSILRSSGRLLGITAVVFLVTSPGILLDPFRFIAELKFQQEVYATGWFGYTVEPGLTHLSAILKYFALQVFSPYWPISIFFAGLSVVGLLALLKEFRAFNVLIVGFVTMWVIYFSGQAAMLVRNLMVMVPLLCLAAARGIVLLSECFEQRTGHAVVAILALPLAFSYVWQIDAAVQVKLRRHEEKFVQQFTDYVAKSPSNTVLISKKLANYIQMYGGQSPENVTTNPDVPYTKVAFLQSEGADIYWEKWPANWWDMYERDFGAKEVNLEAYPTFVGNERILLTSTAHFDRLPLKTADLFKP